MAYTEAIRANAHVSADDFFVGLKVRADKIARTIAKRTADSMVYSLSHRQKLKGGNGQYPKWFPDARGMSDSSQRYDSLRTPSKKSHQGWKVASRAKGEYWVTNDATGDGDYNYPYNLITGKGWSDRVWKGVMDGGGATQRLIMKNGLIFSRQLPNGLEPWLKIKRVEMQNNIRKEFRKKGLKNVYK